MAGVDADLAVAGVSRCTCTALRMATRRISQLYDLALAPSGLKITQRAVLAEIRRSGSTTAGRLAAALVMDSGALAHAMKPLERDGFVAIEVDPSDRRGRLIGLTEVGRTKLAESDVLWAQAQESFDAAVGGKSRSFRETLQFLISDDFAEQFDATTNSTEEKYNTD